MKHLFGNIGPKTLISFDLLKYVEKHCNGPKTPLFLIWLAFLAMIKKRLEHRFMFVKNIALTKNWFVVSIFYLFPEHHKEK